jgi:hypothetical protein
VRPALLLARAGSYAAQVTASAPVTDIPEATNYLLGCSTADGALTQTPGDNSVRPYMSQYGCIGLARAYEVTGKPEYAAAAWAWLHWYADRMDPTTGYVNDYTGTSGTWTDTGSADSTDAYAGMYLAALWTTYRATNDDAQLTSLAASIPLAYGALVSTQQDDGLTWALPTYHARYLEDNVEAAAGITAAAYAAQQTGQTSTTAAANTASNAMSNGLSALWDRINHVWFWAVDDYHNFTANDWTDENSRRQQVWATGWGLVLPGAADLMTGYVEHQPDWATKTSSYEVMPIWAYRRLGSLAAARAGAATLAQTVEDNGHTYPWTVATSGQMVVAQYGFPAAFADLAPYVIDYGSGGNAFADPEFLYDSDGDGRDDDLGTYGEPTMTLLPLTSGTGNVQRMTVPDGNSWDMRWINPINVTEKTYWNFSVYRRVDALHAGDGQAVLKYELLGADGNLVNPGSYGFDIVSTVDTDVTRWSIHIFAIAGTVQVRCIVGISNGGTVNVAYPQFEPGGSPSAFAGGVPTFPA